MSLKAFHLLFVMACIVLAGGFGLWAIREYRQDGEALNLVMAIAALMAGAALVWYSKWFLRKLKNVSYI